MNNKVFVILFVVLVLILSGCQAHSYLRLNELNLSAKDGVDGYYDSNRDGKADFFTYIDDSGRINRIGYDNDVDGLPDVIINMDEIPSSKCRHLVIILDGFGYDVVSKFLESGKLKMFYPPSRVVSPYPSVTELSISAILNSYACKAVQSKYFDRKTNSMSGGVMDYMEGKNEPFDSLLTYRAPQRVDVSGYIFGKPTFDSELKTVKRLFDKRQSKEVIAYFVSSAAVSVHDGAAGQMECLDKLNNFLIELLWQSRGLLKVTMLADHGLSYEKVKRLYLGEYLENKDWVLKKNHIEDPNDVVLSTLGIVTYACLSTRRPEALSEDLIDCEGIDLVSYAVKDSVKVLSQNGNAIIRKNDGRYFYEPQKGDPLLLEPVLRNITPDERGSYDASDLLRATTTHIYPAPLQRLWEAHFCRVENPPDVIVSLKDNYCVGPSMFFDMAHVFTTHGSLDYNNSITFLMSTAGKFIPVMRSEEIHKQMEFILDQTWPLCE